jgi:hypothetical protein
MHISKKLDLLANSLELKGHIKEAYTIDKIADMVDTMGVRHRAMHISKKLDLLANRLELKGRIREAYTIDKIADMVDAMDVRHRAIYTFTNPQEYKKACDLLDIGIVEVKKDIDRQKYEYAKVDSMKQISIPEENHEIVEKMFEKNGIKNYKRSSSEVVLNKK